MGRIRQKSTNSVIQASFAHIKGALYRLFLLNLFAMPEGFANFAIPRIRQAKPLEAIPGVPATEIGSRRGFASAACGGREADSHAGFICHRNCIASAPARCLSPAIGLTYLHKGFVFFRPMHVWLNNGTLEFTAYGRLNSRHPGFLSHLLYGSVSSGRLKKGVAP